MWLLMSYPKLAASLGASKEELSRAFPFDGLWYQRKYLKESRTVLSPFVHYLQTGARRGWFPNRRFQPEAYSIFVPEVVAKSIPASLHYLLEGWKNQCPTNFLDGHLRWRFGRENQIRISSLLDCLLAEGEGIGEGGHQKIKVNSLVERLFKAMKLQQGIQRPNPDVSVIIPVHNQLPFTLACLISTFESNPTASLEVIVADDCSNDATHETLSQLCSKTDANFRVARTPGNYGFIGNCNHAAGLARGTNLFFLNNDTVVLPNCIDALVEVLSDRLCGAVGAKLINLDGTLQEAGGVIWQGFEAWNYGRGRNLMDPAYNYRRSVDYCSGASLMIPRPVFENAGGFSKELEVAYGEDSDLCMTIRHKLGLDVVYEPKACVIHFEGQSCGRSIETGTKRYQILNQRKLAQKWKSVTDTFTQAADKNSQTGPRRHMGWPRVCIIDHYLARFDRESGSRRLKTIAEILKSMDCHVYFLAENLFPEEPYTTALRDMGVELIVGANLFGTTCEQMMLERLSAIDLVWCVRPYITETWLRFFRRKDPRIKIAFDTGDIHWERMQAEERCNGTFQPRISESEKMREKEERLCRETDITVAISQHDAHKLRSMGADRVEVVSGIYRDCTSPDDPAFSYRRGLLFVGSSHRPNTDGILWFLRDVWPLLQQSDPQLEMTILGNIDEELRAAASVNVRFAGYVPDVAPYFRQARVFVCPLRFGAGIKGKLGQSIEYGLPFVTTSVGASGMNFVHEKDALICDSALEFARAVSRLNRKNDLWSQLRKNLMCHLDIYSPATARVGLEKILALVPGYRASE
jgi:GT2 family glycosyltransferase